MKMKASELSGAALDWAVGVAVKGADRVIYEDDGSKHVSAHSYHEKTVAGYWHGWMPSTQWSQGGPLIEREDYALPFKAPFHRKHLGQYQACTPGGFPHNGPTPLIAACRAIVAAKLGDEVEIPDELCKPD